MTNLVLSIFPGIDLLGRGFEEEGFCIVRGPDPIWGGDIRTFNPPPWVFDGVIGGPPCQSFSALVHLVRANGFEPHFGNLIPEFERVVAEALPRWFLMENVPKAPIPTVQGYHPTHTLMLNNRWLGAEQMRLRRFCFGVRLDLPDVALDISPSLVALEAPVMMVAVTGKHNNGGNEELYARNGKTVISGNGFESGSTYTRHNQAVLGSDRAVPDRYGGSGKEKATYIRTANTVTSTMGGRRCSEKQVEGYTHNYSRSSTAVTSSDGSGTVKMVRYSIEEAARLQGWPGLTLDDCPFTKEGKLKAIANGVPREMALAMAKAINVAMGGNQ